MGRRGISFSFISPRRDPTMADTEQPEIAARPRPSPRKSSDCNRREQRDRPSHRAPLCAGGSKSGLLRYSGDHRTADRQTNRAGWWASALCQDRRDEAGRLRPHGRYRPGEVRRVDILYNNAGAGIRKKLHEHTDEEWNFVLNVNLNACFAAPARYYRISSRKVAVTLSLLLPPSVF